jgi:carbonic anhydrase
MLIMRKFFIAAVLSITLCVWTVVSVAAGGGVGITADDALKRLIDGNKRYVESQMNACKQTTKETRDGLVKGQKPYAVILSCSDSRVPPEIIFDTTLGELFVVRVAGNVPDPVILGSIEYAAEHIGSPLIMVLGHERCGAVTATVDSHGKPEGNIGAIVKKITPAVKKAKQEGKVNSKEQLVEAAIDNNIRLVAESLTKQSPVLKHLVHEGKVKIVKAKYDLDDGIVTLFEK